MYSFSALGTDSLYFPDQTLVQLNEHSVKNYLKKYFPELANPDIDLDLEFERNTNASHHYTFSVLYRQIPLLHSTIKVNTDNKGRIFSIKKEVMDLSLLINYSPENELQQWNSVALQEYAGNFWPADHLLSSTSFNITAYQNRPVVVAELNSWNATHDNTLVLDISGNLLFECDQTRHINIDTLINVRIFNPDPLTASGQVYGGIYKDLGDANSPWMDPLYLQTTVDATFDTGTNTFYLENQYVVISDLESPVVAPLTSTLPSFLYNRSMSGFEDVNALYHITNFHNYISSIGYDTLMDLQLVVDPHAQNGFDNSVFNRNGGNPNIMFGTGGVDDAEDADVIIHEYSHGVSWSANNNSSFSFERSGLDEGLADYFATSYSRSISSFNWADMFSWDGHNEFWAGRTATTTLNYPYTGPNFYAVGEIWNTAMSAIWTDLGNIVTDKLMLESLHFFTNNTTLSEAAIYVLQSDTILFGGVHSSTICNHFKNKNILDANCKPVGIAETTQRHELSLINTQGFASGLGNATLHFPESISGRYIIYDISGRKIIEQDISHEQKLILSPSLLKTGMYFLLVETDKGQQVFKLNRF